MKIYMVWVYDWPQEMVLATNELPTEGVHNRQAFVYKYQNRREASTVYFREEKEIKNMIYYFELEPDQVKEIDL